MPCHRDARSQTESTPFRNVSLSHPGNPEWTIGGAIVGYGPCQSTKAHESTRPDQEGEAHLRNMNARRRSTAQDECRHRFRTSSSPTPQDDLAHATEQQEGIGRDLYYGVKPTR